MNMMGNRGTATYGCPFHVPTEGWYTHVACWTGRTASREGMPIRDPVACQSAWPGGNRPPHPAELARGLSMTKLEGRWAAVRRALQFTALLQRDALGTEPASYVTTGVHNTFELMATALRRSSTSSSVLCSLFSDAMDLPQEACLDFPRARELEEAAAHYRTLFVA